MIAFWKKDKKKILGSADLLVWREEKGISGYAQDFVNLHLIQPLLAIEVELTVIFNGYGKDIRR